MLRDMKTIICSLALVLGNGIAASCMAQSNPSDYTIREDEPGVNSHIRRTLMESKTIAVNKRYHELSAEDRAELHSWWESMPEGDEPPFPAYGLKPVHSAMLEAQSMLRVEGELYLVATVDSNGEVIQVKAVGSPSPEMTKFAASVIGVTKFKPAICGGKPCKMDYPFSYKFTMGP
ncbi:hypothetical protein ASD07_07355 [Duganella sp. Root336D2]|nr:hypothetical protein ASD07_07355 [Duganella sp. Root336D2]